jgi:hypothetical protein
MVQMCPHFLVIQEEEALNPTIKLIEIDSVLGKQVEDQ